MWIGEQITINIKSIVDATDKFGVEYLKCKAFRATKYLTPKGKLAPKYDNFVCHLYGAQELLQLTKDRLFSQTIDKPVLKLVCTSCDISTPVIMGRLVAILRVDEFDFATQKYGTVRKNLKKEKELSDGL